MRSAMIRWVGVTVVAIATAGCTSALPAKAPAAPRHASATGGVPRGGTGTRSTTTSPTSQQTPDATAGADDEAALSNLYDACGGTCQYEVATTSDGAGGTLYGIELVAQFPDGYGRGAVFFFHGPTLLAGTGSLAPGTSVQHGSGLDWVLGQEAGAGISVPSPGRFAVTYVVSSGPNMCNACDGDDGTDTYVYRWNGAAMVVESGTPPTPPAVIGDGTG